MKYEAPEIEITRFDVKTRIMDVPILPGDDGDGDLNPIPSDEYTSDPGDLYQAN